MRAGKLRGGSGLAREREFTNLAFETDQNTLTNQSTTTYSSDSGSSFVHYFSDAEKTSTVTSAWHYESPNKSNLCRHKVQTQPVTDHPNPNLLVLFEVVTRPFLAGLRLQTYAKTYAAFPRDSLTHSRCILATKEGRKLSAAT